MITMFEGGTVFKIVLISVVVGMALGAYITHKAHKFLRKHV